MIKERLRSLWKNRTFRIVLICVVALALLFAVWKVFFGGGSAEEASGYMATEREQRLAELLEQVEGVDTATVMIAERDGVPVSAIVVFKGRDGILLRTRLTELAAAALDLAIGDITVCPAD